MPDLDSHRPEQPGLRAGQRIAVALAITVTAALVALTLRPVLESWVIPVFLLAIGGSALGGGLWPGLLSVVLSGLAVHYWFTLPPRSWGFAGLPDLIRQVLFWSGGILLAAVLARARANRQAIRAEAAESERHRREAERRARDLEALAEEAGRSAAIQSEIARAEAAVSSFATRCFRGPSFEANLADAAATLARTLDVQLVQVLEALPSGQLLVRSGVGWREGVVGRATLSAGPDSPAGRALRSPEPLVTVEPAGDQPATLAVEHGAKNGVLVAIPGAEAGDPAAGLIAIYAVEPRAFTSPDIRILREFAYVLSAVFGREAWRRRLNQTFEPRTILIVEESPGERAAGCRALELAGYRWLSAGDGTEAEELFTRYRFPIDLVIVSAELPDMPGTALVERLAALRKDLVVLYSTEWTPDDASRMGLVPAGVPVIQKPFSPAVLVATARELLGWPAGELEAAGKTAGTEN